MNGYGHAAYAASLSSVGRPRLLEGSRGWILERPIADSPYRDGMGCYPIFVCENWSQLAADLNKVAGLVCLSLVTDPFGDCDQAQLRQAFPHLVISFKQHYVVELSRAYETFVSPHHRRNAHKALTAISVKECASPSDVIDDWIHLYANLTKRHNITGIPAFSRESFAKQLTVPGIRLFRADHGDDTVGMIWWYEHGNRSYYHLAAYSDLGYELGASFALFEHSIKYFSQRGFEWLSLGSSPGLDDQRKSGLGRFKAGWSTGTLPSYFCGRIFDHAKYDEIVLTKSAQGNNYFPAYRLGEFG